MASTRLHVEDYTIGWICALPIEMAAAIAMLDDQHEPLPQPAHDHNLYTFGCIESHNVVLACLPAGVPGTTSAAIVATQILSTFSAIKFGLMVGVGGGVPSPEVDIRLGDVVVSKPRGTSGGVIQYDFGKTVREGRFVRTGSLNGPPSVLLNAVSRLEIKCLLNGAQLPVHLSKIASNYPRLLSATKYPGVKHDQLFEADYDHRGSDGTCLSCDTRRLVLRSARSGNDPMIHYGLIASGNQVMRDGATRERLRKELGVLCFEMEAAGLMNNFPCLVIRGICDYADSHKNKNWQPYAAATAAACAKEVLSVIPAAVVTPAMLRSAIDSITLDQFLPMLSVADQEEHKLSIPPLDCDLAKFYWIFKNVDFMEWSSANEPQVLWLSGPPKCSIHRAASHIVDQAKNRALDIPRSVLYFFCATSIGTESIITTFIHTTLYQIISSSPMDKKMLIVRKFLFNLLEDILNNKEATNRRLSAFSVEATPDTNIKKILEAPPDGLWAALRAALAVEQSRELSIVIDGLEHVHLINGVRAFIEHLQQRTSKVKILLTSGPQAHIKDAFDGLPCIEYDQERKACLSSLHFDNTRFGKIQKGYKESFEWLWTHAEFKKWSTLDFSRVLLIQGKPGSGKSTLTKYFNNNLLEREPAASSAIVARFFYSYREGELQRSHYSMLRSILYDILYEDEAFFYHRFQIEYRAQHCREAGVDWEYGSLKRVLKSLRDHSLAKRLYLIIDAVDESEDDDRRNILKLLFELCAETKHCVMKIFVASRPVGQLEVLRSGVDDFIRLQDETVSDISRFARSLLDGHNVRRLLTEATEYIVKNAQGVFLWVKLIGEELLSCEEEGYSEEEVFEFLKRLPTELKDFYKLMFDRMNRNTTNLRDEVKTFRFTLFAKRPLSVDELLHALGIPDYPETQFTPSNDSFHRRIPSESRIISCGGNFLEIKSHYGYRTVQVMHQTVREFFLDPDGPVAESEFAMYEKDAHVCISITCIRYLMLCAANISTEELPDINRWASKHFKDYAQRLDEKPLANYALCHLKDHIDGCQGDANVQNIVSQFIGKLNHNPAVYLLEGWVNSCLNKILLRIGEATAATDFKNKVLHTAVRNGLPTAAEMLLTAGANVNERDQEGRTPLSWAAEGGHQTVVKLLLETGKADVDSRDHNGRTPLSMAAEGGHQTVIKLLLETGRANVDPKGNNGRTPLSMAAERGHQTVVKLLLETSKADVDSKDHNGRTPLSLAAEGGHEAVVKLLLQTGKADVESEDYNDRTPLSFAEWRGHDAVVRLLMESQVMGKGKERFLHLPPQQNLCSDSSSLDSSPVGSFSDEIWAAMSA